MKKIASQTTATLTRNGMLALASAIAPGPAGRSSAEHEEHDLDGGEAPATYPLDSAVKPRDETRYAAVPTATPSATHHDQDHRE